LGYIPHKILHFQLFSDGDFKALINKSFKNADHKWENYQVNFTGHGFQSLEKINDKT